MRYWFVDREDMEFAIKVNYLYYYIYTCMYYFIIKIAIKNHEFLEYGEYGPNLYGTRYDSIHAIIDAGKTAVLDPSPQSLKLLRSSPGKICLPQLPIQPRSLGEGSRTTQLVISSKMILL